MSDLEADAELEHLRAIAAGLQERLRTAEAGRAALHDGARARVAALAERALGDLQDIDDEHRSALGALWEETHARVSRVLDELGTDGPEGALPPRRAPR